MYSIFIHHRPLYIVPNALVINDFDDGQRNYLVINNSKDSSFDAAIKALEENLTDFVLWRCDDVHRDFEFFCQNFEWIEAAGGVVFNDDNDVLLMERLGFYDLPKGKIDAGEMPRQAAVREVAEECGIPAPRIIAPLPPTYHTYTQAGKKILKKTYWYTMQHTGSSALVPQTEEGITQVFWVNKADVPQYYTKMYAALVPLLQNVVDTMP